MHYKVKLCVCYRESAVPIEPMELQVDYWVLPNPANQASAALKGDQNKGRPDSNKSTLKTTFRGLQVQRLPQHGQAPTNLFHMSYTIKESKKKSKLQDKINKMKYYFCLLEYFLNDYLCMLISFWKIIDLVYRSKNYT